MHLEKRFVRYLEIFGILSFIGMISMTEFIFPIMALFGFKSQGVFLQIFIAYHSILNILKYFVSRPILHELCPHGEQSLYMQSVQNNDLQYFVKIGNYLIQNAITQTKQKSRVGTILLFLLGFFPFMTLAGILLSALNENYKGFLIVLSGDCLRMLLLGFGLL